MRADRLLSILLLLQVHRRQTTRALAQRLEVSERTIHRDMDALSAAGVPVVADRGAQGGWRLLEAYQTDLTGLTGAEAQALAVPLPDRLLADLGLSQDARAATTKLLAALPSAHREGAAFFRERLLVDTSTWREPGETIAAFGTLQEAVWRARRLAVSYQRGDGTQVERELEPLGLVAKGANWYLVARCDGELRSYRASRFLSATLLDVPFERPKDFDLRAFWADSTSDFVATLPQFRLEGRCAPDLLPRLRWAGKFSKLEQQGPPEPDGWSRVTVRVQTPEEAVEYALGFGPRFEVLAPSDIRRRVAEEAQRTASFYASRPEPGPQE
jgi:predicted DNA-binding transcriptional regulator YafY